MFAKEPILHFVEPNSQSYSLTNRSFKPFLAMSNQTNDIDLAKLAADIVKKHDEGGGAKPPPVAAAADHFHLPASNPNTKIVIEKRPTWAQVTHPNNQFTALDELEEAAVFKAVHRDQFPSLEQLWHDTIGLSAITLHHGNKGAEKVCLLHHAQF